MRTEILSERFVLRELTVSDVTERYLGWLRDPETRKYIATASSTQGLVDLRAYVEERVDRDDVLFLGVFDRTTGMHIGNIKYEPVDSELGYAVMGVLIGEPAYRGKGVTPEILRASTGWLRENRNIKQIILGVSKDNHGAIRAYEKSGFAVASSPFIPDTPGALTMVWEL